MNYVLYACQEAQKARNMPYNIVVYPYSHIYTNMFIYVCIFVPFIFEVCLLLCRVFILFLLFLWLLLPVLLLTFLLVCSLWALRRTCTHLTHTHTHTHVEANKELCNMPLSLEKSASRRQRCLKKTYKIINYIYYLYCQAFESYSHTVYAICMRTQPVLLLFPMTFPSLSLMQCQR